LRIVGTYSHLNGFEYLQFHHKSLWDELVQVVGAVDAAISRTKVSNEKRIKGRQLLSPTDLNLAFKKLLTAEGWAESRVTYFVTADQSLARATLDLDAPDQKIAIEGGGAVAISTYNQTDFVRDRIAIEVQFGKYAFVAYDVFVKHVAFYSRNQIDCGIEILPMKSMKDEMSSGPSYFEREIYNLIRQGRGVPAVPLVILGIDI
jgi:hypothetical protein